MSVKSLIVIAISALLIAGSAFARTPSPESAQVYIISPTDGMAVNSPVTVKFGLKGMGVAPAGIDKRNTGHHHLLIDVVDIPSPDKSLPADVNFKHFGGGQTEAIINLSSGKHTLQLIMGDKNHIPLFPLVMSKKITIEVN
ncbi:MAG: DUF4399 domain-containing protein [Nitrosomonadaceae bacterium]|nr:DUF4399 domain-containing protein [Nitrosomonadaceae bacterium]